MSAQGGAITSPSEYLRTLGHGKKHILHPAGVALIIKRLGTLIPHVSFVDFNPMTAAYLAEFILKRHLSMVFLLVRNISFDLLNVGFTHGKDSISTLPLEMLQTGVPFLDPF